MKKLLALALCALMMVCAVAPAFAAEAALPDAFADAERVNFREQVDPLFEDGELSWGAATGFPWNAADFTAGGQFERLEGNAFLFMSADFVLEADFTPAEDGEYAFAMYIANKTTKGNGKDLLDSTKAGKFAVRIMKDGTEVASYEIVEEEAEIGSRLYYTLAEGVALEADTDYTVCVQMTENTDSCIVDFLYVLPGAEDDAEDTSAAADDTSAAADDTSASAGEDTSASAGEDTSADAGEDTTAPATFDVALIALAVAGASAAAAVVSKKRR